MPGKKERKREVVQTAENDPDSVIQNFLREGEIFLFLHGAKYFYNSTIKSNRALDLFKGTGSVGFH